MTVELKMKIATKLSNGVVATGSREVRGDVYTIDHVRDQLITAGSIKRALSVLIIVVLSMLGSESVTAEDYNPTAKLIASDGLDFDFLGKELDFSGNTVVVGAAQHDHAGIGLDSGGAYIFSADATGMSGPPDVRSSLSTRESRLSRMISASIRDGFIRHRERLSGSIFRFGLSALPAEDCIR